MTKKELEHELGRFQKKVADQQKEINNLKETVKANETVEAMSEAFLALVLEKSGRGKANPVIVTTKEIAEAVKERKRPALHKPEDAMEFHMWYETREQA